MEVPIEELVHFGTGPVVVVEIGLIVCEQILDRHGGAIEYAANSPQGTEVRILLPLADSE